MKVAVIGGGVSGIGATWLLNEHSPHEVHLYEAAPQLGGHATFPTFTFPGKEPVSVDVGFILFNTKNYPNFLRFVKLFPGLKPHSLKLTASISSLSSPTSSIRTLPSLVHPSRLLDPSAWRRAYDVARFGACARELISDENAAAFGGLSMREYIRRERFSTEFVRDYLNPMSAAIWSTPADKTSLDFPARALTRFLFNHNLLHTGGDTPDWLTFSRSSNTYIKEALAHLPSNQLHLATSVQAVRTLDSGRVQLTTSSGAIEEFDHIVIATHSDATLRMLEAGGRVTSEERAILGSVKWNTNRVVLHYDEALMPSNRADWACWNCLTLSDPDPNNERLNKSRVSLTYWMNAIQGINEEKHGLVFVTSNPPVAPDPSKTIGVYAFDHPQLDANAIRAQEKLPEIQNTRGLSYAGAWNHYGFHEDGFTAGLLAVTKYSNLPDVFPPFDIVPALPSPNESVLAAKFFTILEHTGSPIVVGAIGSTILSAVRGAIHLGVLSGAVIAAFTCNV